MKKILLSTVLTVVLLFLLTGCVGQPSIMGKWYNSNSDTYEEYMSDNTYTYTNSIFTELGYLEGQWEDIDRQIEAEGKIWDVYLVIPQNREIINYVGDDKNNLGNKYQYNDGYGDYYLLVSDKDSYKIIGAPNLDRIEESKEIDDISKELTHSIKS